MSYFKNVTLVTTGGTPVDIVDNSLSVYVTNPTSGSTYLTDISGDTITTADENGINSLYVSTLLKDRVVSSGLTSSGDTLEVDFEGKNSSAVALYGSWTGTCYIEGTVDEINWVRIWVGSISDNTVASGVPDGLYEITENGTYRIFNTLGLVKIRVYAHEMTGTCTTTLSAVGATPTHSYTNSSILQNVQIDDNNSSTTNILSGATWSGTSTSTLGVVGLQFSIHTDQNCTVCIQQSPDGTNWDISDEYDYIATLGGDGWTTQAQNSYVRVLVTNVGVTGTTFLRTQMALCPIVEALPRTLSDDGRLKSECHISDQNDRHVKVSSQQEMLTSPVYRLVGASFKDTNDPNFWTGTTSDGGTLTYDGDVLFNTSVDPAGSAQLDSIRTARFVPGSDNVFKGMARLTTAPTTGNTRTFGAYDDDNGFFFQVSGETFSVVVRKDGVDTVVDNGSFNGIYGTTTNLNTSFFKFFINFRQENLPITKCGWDELTHNTNIRNYFRNSCK